MHTNITFIDGLLDYPGAQAAIKARRALIGRNVIELKSHPHWQQTVIINLDNATKNTMLQHVVLHANNTFFKERKPNRTSIKTDRKVTV